jgi:UDP-N-acetylmuramate dehydrogenase
MISLLDRAALRELQNCGNLRFNAPMKEYTTFQAGGPADMLITPRRSDDVSTIIQIARHHSLPLTVIGGGSNLLVSDKGIRGMVIRMNCAGAPGEIAVGEDGSIIASSSLQKEDFIAFALDRGFGGTEFMAGIPGCLGGGIIMNAGTEEGTFVSILTAIRYLNRDGALVEHPITSDMGTYRSLQIEEGAIILSATYRLPAVDRIAPVRKRIAAIIEERRHKHPLDYPTAGSVFKNPEGFSSWKLIDDAGLKGYRVGGAAISELHTNFIINIGNATSHDISTLIALAIERVHDRFGIRLEPEIRLIGEV